MTLTRPAYVVEFQNDSVGYSFTTTHGEIPDPSANVLLGDGLTYSWQFRDNNAPGAREPAVLSMKLRCRYAVVAPVIEEGNSVKVTCTRPALPADATYFVIGGRVSDVSAVWERGRMTIAFTVTEHQADMAQSFELADYAARITAELAAGESWIDALAKFVIPGESTVAYAQRTWEPGSGDDPSTLAKTPMRLAGARTVLETIEQAAAVQFRSSERTVFVPMVAAEINNWPYPDPPFYVYEPQGQYAGLMYMAEWAAVTEITVLPYKLANTAGSTIGPVDRAGVSLHDNPGAILIDAALVEASPTWLRDRSRAINRTELKGFASTAVDDEAMLAIVDTTAIEASGPIVRSIDTLASIPDLAASADFPTAESVYQAYPSGGSGWSPETLKVKTHLMIDDELDAYAGRFDPRTQLQQTIIVIGIEDAQNMAQGPLVATLTGCDFTINDGRMEIQPELRPFAPSVLSSSAVSWDDFTTYWPAATFDDLDPAWTFTQALLTEDH